MPNLLSQIMEYNRSFVEEQKYEPYLTSKFPDRKFVILTCMDTRLIELLPASMNIKNGDVKMIKAAGGVVSTPFGGIMRSIIVAIYELGADEVLVVGHHDCGMSHLNPERVKEKFVARGIKEETLKTLEYSGLNLERWLRGFEDVKESVKSSVNIIKNHPLVPDIPVHGLVIDPSTGKLDVIVNGY
ncbi:MULTISPECIES: beta-class carbonic anhydrase [Paenibacillus]|uniref:carbonic anhydrase n=2 Tax=Paenibacillus TaxID=44249 RepID=A0A163YPQ2_9BACL|nr:MULTISPECIES: carbonic anhydrase [Paenibacillus]KZE79987.1 carbonic anhydrase [Paenibacillus elgii]MBU7317078.1 carbonic anhydrase [Paenibacillus oleatilyticus]MCM3274054.1 carbonic anhydrase [Paenibacillus elgii]NEN81826.1 carbonic anhydrase [Paenibacillus elgii]PUA41067.1 carbonic anhydrase [Paenibacillus elgii]